MMQFRVNEIENLGVMGREIKCKQILVFRNILKIKQTYAINLTGKVTINNYTNQLVTFRRQSWDGTE